MQTQKELNGIFVDSFASDVILWVIILKIKDSYTLQCSEVGPTCPFFVSEWCAHVCVCALLFV